MILVVISDSHGNIANLKQVLGFAKNVNAEAIIHCGDWNSVSAVETVLQEKLPLFAVLGNADVDPEINYLLKLKCKKFETGFLELDLDGKKIGVVHKIADAIFKKSELIFYGHTHRQLDSIKNEVRVVNPGALENDIHFAIFDTQANKVQLIHE